ncbi:aminotransferase class I/II-fold pyridoxal phosphate-dependent enzyme [Nonomuraea bangladeshensis]|uniref:aminotransferase class I/II-fold pyridoxal phosphate-dependent enzyme n=1 Tax=Nonomuraea bangladeshensis TaxID=404385 RepID=UPI0031DD1A52
MADVFDKCRSWETHRIFKSAGLYPFAPPVETMLSPGEARIHGRPVIMAASNDYLGLSADPRVREAARKAIAEHGTSCSGSRLANGTYALHLELEERLAAFLHREAAVALSTGFQTNLAVSALLGEDDVVLTDQDNHASLRDAVRLGGAVERVFRHNDTKHLEWLLADTPAGSGVLIVTEGVFSMAGDMCDLPRIAELAGRHGARLMLDCAHDLGVLGADGRGVPELLGLESGVDLVMTTFSKSLASLGGALAGEADVIDYIRHWASPAVFSASMTPASVAAALKALELVEAEPERRRRVMDNAARLRDGLRRLGYEVGSAPTPVVPVHVGDFMTCLRLWRALFDAGVFTGAVIHPAVQHGRELIRISATAAHTDAQLDRIIGAFAEAGTAVGVIGPQGAGR